MRQSLLWSFRHRRGPLAIVIGLGVLVAAIGIGYLVTVDELARWGVAVGVAAAAVTGNARRRHIDAVSRELAGLAIDPPRRRRPRHV